MLNVNNSTFTLRLGPPAAHRSRSQAAFAPVARERQHSPPAASRGAAFAATRKTILRGLAVACAAGRGSALAARGMAALAGASPKTRVAIYGGAFDPPTVDHMRACAQILRSSRVDEVWLTPCGARPDKPALRTSTSDRWAMCEIAVNTVFPPRLPVKVCDVDVTRDRAFFTYDLLNKLSAEHDATHEFVFVVGTDWFQEGTDIRTWESDAGGERKVTGHLLVEEYDFLVLKRPGFPPHGDLSDYGPRFSYLDVDGDEEMIEGNGSSTAVRNRLKKTGDLDSAAGLVPAGVLAYIYRHHLYFDDDKPAVFH